MKCSTFQAYYKDITKDYVALQVKLNRIGCLRSINEQMGKDVGDLVVSKFKKRHYEISVTNVYNL